MKVIPLSVILIFVLCPGCASTNDSKEIKAAEDDLARVISEPATIGSVNFQAKFDGVDYRKILGGAIRKNKSDLVAIFSYSASNLLQGEGAETNIGVLHDLLRLWGDHDFSAVLRTVPKSVQRSVITFLREDYSFKDAEFPKTTSLVPPGE